MDVKVSLEVALAKKKKNRMWLADQMGINHQNLTSVGANGHANTRTIKRICDALEMKVSEFIALSEA